MTDSILKSRDITLLTKVHLVKGMVFPVAMFGCESWTIMKAECWRIDAFELWSWRRLLRVPWTARRYKSILKEISPEYSLERLMLKLKLQYFATWYEELTHWKGPDAGKDWRQKEKGMTEDKMVGWYHWLNGHEFEQAPGVGDGQGSLACFWPWSSKELDITEQLNWLTDWRKSMECHVFIHFIFTHLSHLSQERRKISGSLCPYHSAQVTLLMAIWNKNHSAFNLSPKLSAVTGNKG